MHWLEFLDLSCHEIAIQVANSLSGMSNRHDRAGIIGSCRSDYTWKSNPVMHDPQIMPMLNQCWIGKEFKPERCCQS